MAISRRKTRAKAKWFTRLPLGTYAETAVCRNCDAVLFRIKGDPWCHYMTRDMRCRG